MEREKKKERSARSARGMPSALRALRKTIYIYIYILFLSSANPVLRKAGW